MLFVLSLPFKCSIKLVSPKYFIAFVTLLSSTKFWDRYILCSIFNWILLLPLLASLGVVDITISVLLLPWWLLCPICMVGSVLGLFLCLEFVLGKPLNEHLRAIQLERNKRVEKHLDHLLCPDLSRVITTDFLKLGEIDLTNEDLLLSTYLPQLSGFSTGLLMALVNMYIQNFLDFRQSQTSLDFRNRFAPHH